jgi:hypothetical protein
LESRLLGREPLGGEPLLGRETLAELEPLADRRDAGPPDLLDLRGREAPAGQRADSACHTLTEPP